MNAPVRMAFKPIDRHILVAYGTASPSDTEWAGFLTLIERRGIQGTALLIATEGGRPTVAQRDQLDDLLGRWVVPVAVVTGSLRVRLQLTVLSWLKPRIRVFRPSDLHDAMAYLEIPTSRRTLIEHELDKLRDAIDAGRIG
jgi:hypothetical protein